MADEEEIIAQAEDDIHAEEADEPDVFDDDGRSEWEGHARKHEREAKKLRKELDQERASRKKREDAEKSEQELAIEKAREEAATAAKTETSQAFRDKLLKAEVRAQAAGKFANPALAIRLLDLDHDTIFDDDGEIDTAAITKAVDDFLEQEPGLKAGGARPGSADAGKGTAGKSREDMTVEDHLAEISRSKK